MRLRARYAGIGVQSFEILGTRSALENPRANSPTRKETVLSLTGWGVLLVVAAAVLAAIVLIIRLVVRHRRGYD